MTATPAAGQAIDPPLATSSNVQLVAPVRSEWFGSPTADSAWFEPHPIFGFMCPVLKPDV